MADLTTLTNVKSFLNIDSTNSNNDAELSRLITSYSSLIRSWVNRDLTTASYVDYCNGTGSNMIMFPNYPVTAVSSVTIDNTVVTSTDYMFDETRLILKNGRTFTYGRNNVVLSYTAGFATVPYEIEQICIEMVSKTFKKRDRIGLSSKGLAGETTSYDLQDMRDETRSLLASYIKVIPV